MLRRNRHFDLRFVLILPVFLLVSGCSRVVKGGFFTLASGETVSGNLWVPFGKVELQEGSQVTGSVLMLCCSLSVNGEVDGDIFLIIGDLGLDSHSTVTGDVVLLSGYYQRPAGSMVGGAFTTSMTPGIYHTIMRPFQICLAAILVLFLTLIFAIVLIVRKRKRQKSGGSFHVGSLENSSL